MTMSAMIKINSNSSTPIYKQIADNIKKLIYQGEIETGEFLPSERVLAQELEVARGTVKKAYQELSKVNLVSANVGKGTQVIVPHSESENEILAMDQLLNSLLIKEYSEKEIETMILGRLKLRSAEEKIQVGVIDCNSEALSIFNRRIKEFPNNVELTNFLLKDVLNFKSTSKAFSGYDLLITTSNHYEELLEVLGDSKDKLIKIVLAPDIETVVAMTLLKNNIKDKNDIIGIFSKTERFKDIVINNLKEFSIEVGEKDFLYEKDSLENIESFLDGKKAIIMPPYYSMSLGTTAMDSLYRFRDKGGNIIIFNYTVEKGSLLHIEEKFQIINGRMKNG